MLIASTAFLALCHRRRTRGLRLVWLPHDSRLVHAGLQGQQGARNPTFLNGAYILFSGIAIYRTLPKAQLALPIYPQREIVSKITESIVRAAIA
jgi:hypothetical protein